MKNIVIVMEEVATISIEANVANTNSDVEPEGKRFACLIHGYVMEEETAAMGL